MEHLLEHIQYSILLVLFNNLIKTTFKEKTVLAGLHLFSLLTGLTV